MRRLLSGGKVWQDTGFEELDLLIEDGIITQHGKNLQGQPDETVDCSDSYILPGLLDMHVHVGEKVCGLELADGWASLVSLANLCGISAIGAFVTENTAADNDTKTLSAQLERAITEADQYFRHPVRWHLTPTRSEPRHVRPLLKRGCDLKFYTTYKPNGLYRPYVEIGRWMQELSDVKPLILVHCEDDDIITSMSELYPFRQPADAANRRPELAEILAVERILDLATQYGYPVHIVHVSCPEAALLIRQAKRSAPVSCETAPHYLLLNESWLLRGDGHRWLCTPPLRSEVSRGLMVELLQEGLFDAIATDHCPFRMADKDRHKDAPEQVPVGLAGLGATFPLLYENLVRTGKLALEKLIPLLTSQPARLMGLYPRCGTIRPGNKPDLLIVSEYPLHFGTEVVASLSDAHNPWQDFSHSVKYYSYEAKYGKA